MTDSAKAPSRDLTLDLMKGIAIIAMIVGHLTPCGRTVIYSFHMPLFFIIAGFLYRSRPPFEALRKDFVRLVVPYIVTAFVIVMFYVLDSSYGTWTKTIWAYAAFWGSGVQLENVPYFGTIYAIGVIWFLLALFWCKFFFTIIEILIRSVYAQVMVCIILSITATVLVNHIPPIPFNILHGVAALVFYAAGYALRQFDAFRRINLWVAALLLAIWVAAIYIPDDFLILAVIKYPVYPLSVAGGIAATCVIYYACRWLTQRRMPLIDFVAWIGEVSIVFLCLHLIDLDLAICKRLFGMPTFLMSFVFDFTLCVLGTFFISQFSFTRRIFKIRRFTLPSLTPRSES